MITVKNALASYYEALQRAADLCLAEPQTVMREAGFRPGFSLPALDDRLKLFFSASTIQIIDLGKHRGVSLRLLDLTCNPRTRTTKTFASLVMVARAVKHIRTTGESILIVTPSSANKGNALRDAVSRAIENQLVEPHQLRIAIVVPRQGVGKLWTLPISEAPHLRALNPIFLVDTEDGRIVKEITRSFVREHSAQLYEQLGLRAWHTYDLDNYRMVDAIRAFVEADHLGYPIPPTVRVHAQAVSSAFGLLGYHCGWRVLTESLGRVCGPHPELLLVQHLGTPDLVLHHLSGSFSRDNLPDYKRDPLTGLLTQSSSSSFPAHTYSTDESIDSTFYSHHPATASMVAGIQQRFGGSGIVVSLSECLERYAYLRQLLPLGAPVLPPDPRELREWALVMVLTGVLGAIERGLVAERSEIIIHASGSYSVRDYTPIAKYETSTVSSARAILDEVCGGKAK